MGTAFTGPGAIQLWEMGVGFVCLVMIVYPLCMLLDWLSGLLAALVIRCRDLPDPANPKRRRQ